MSDHGRSLYSTINLNTTFVHNSEIQNSINPTRFLITLEIIFVNLFHNVNVIMFVIMFAHTAVLLKGIHIHGKFIVFTMSM